MLQAFPIDGSKIPALAIRLRAKGKDLRPGQSPNEMPYVVVTFYDESQRTLAERAIGPFRGTFDWQDEHGVVRVPPKAMHAILRVGLLGAVGEMDIDNISITPAK
jgi:hypothetical protein